MSARIGGLLAVAVSIGLAVTLPLRDVGYNALNLFTVVLATLAGSLAIAGAQPERAGRLAWAIVLLLLAMVPTIFGWVVLLYVPSLALLLYALSRPVAPRSGF